MPGQVVLKAGREKSLRRRHPWIFSGAVARVEGSAEAGDTVRICSADGEALGVGAYNPRSQIAVRVWDHRDREIDAAFFKARVEAAIAMRGRLLPQRDAVRLIHAESDGLPGVVADRYGDVIVLQLSSAGAMRHRDEIADALNATLHPACIYERSDADVLQIEGMPSQTGLIRGSWAGARHLIEESGLKFEVDFAGGHKTGFYLDQRANRARLRELARQCSVLDCFAYTGGFTVNAIAGGAANVTAVDSSGPALDILKRNVEHNGLSAPDCIEGDVFQVLRGCRDRARRFDVIVLDPPKLAPTAAHAEKAARAYKDANLLAFKLLNEGGLLFTFSCSGGVSRDLFQKIVAGAAVDAGVRAQIVEQFSAGPDHPVALEFPEGEYLKGLLCRVQGRT